MKQLLHERNIVRGKVYDAELEFLNNSTRYYPAPHGVDWDSSIERFNHALRDYELELILSDLQHELEKIEIKIKLIHVYDIDHNERNRCLFCGSVDVIKIENDVWRCNTCGSEWGRNHAINNQLNKNDASPMNKPNPDQPIGLDKQLLEYEELYAYVSELLEAKSVEISIFEADFPDSCTWNNEEYYNLKYRAFTLEKELNKWVFWVEKTKKLIDLFDSYM
jgi:ribosomal protein L37AE/L43A